MNSLNNLLSEVSRSDLARFSRCRVHFNGKAGAGREGEYSTGGEPFEVEISPEQARVLSVAQDKFAGHIKGSITYYEGKVLESCPTPLVNRFETRVEMASHAQVALYDLIE